MRTLLRVLLALIILSGVPGYAHAQATTLRLLEPVTAKISPESPVQRWTFEAVQGQHLSARMEATSGDLSPYIELQDSSGSVLATGVYSSFRYATIDDFEVPRSATYTLRATYAPAEPTGGDYRLILVPGFSYVLLNGPIDARTPLRLWTEPAALAQLRGNKFYMQTLGENHIAWTGAEKLDGLRDLYVQIDGQPEPGSRYWEMGLMVRGVRRGSAIDAYFFLINSNRQWKFVLNAADQITALRDWTDLPPKSPEAAYTLGLLVSGDRFTPFYGGLPLATLTDQTLHEAGLVGVAVEAGAPPNDFAAVSFDNLVITLPANDVPGTETIQPPAVLRAWQDKPEAILVELRDARLIPGMGRLGFGIDEAFVTNSTPGGIVVVRLARGSQFSDLVYSADVLWDSSSDNTACALEFRAADDANFSIVYFDRKGGYGLRQASGGNPILSLYDLVKPIHTDNRATNRVTVIAIGSGLVVYINGVRVASVNTTQVSGAIYIAAYNYAQAANYCRFNNIWLQHFDWR